MDEPSRAATRSIVNKNRETMVFVVIYIELLYYHFTPLHSFFLYPKPLHAIFFFVFLHHSNSHLPRRLILSLPFHIVKLEIEEGWRPPPRRQTSPLTHSEERRG